MVKKVDQSLVQEEERKERREERLEESIITGKHWKVIHVLPKSEQMVLGSFNCGIIFMTFKHTFQFSVTSCILFVRVFGGGFVLWLVLSND